MNENNRRFIELIGEYLDELRDLLGAGWPAFRDYLLEFTDRLWMAANLRQQLEAIDDLLEYCQHSPAQDLIWSLLRQAPARPTSPLESTRIGKEMSQPQESDADDLEPIRAASSALAEQIAAQEIGVLEATSFSTLPPPGATSTPALPRLTARRLSRTISPWPTTRPTRCWCGSAPSRPRPLPPMSPSPTRRST